MRYAVYFTPPKDDPLTITAANWLGRDAFSGKLTDVTVPDGFDAVDFHGLTAEPRRYGFHATLKAPFHLKEGRTEADLVTAFSTFAAGLETFEIPEIILGRLGSFYALVPGGPCEALRTYADACVTTFEPFRAALTPDDIARRKPDELSTGQRMSLMTWGYPYVFDDFRFHMTLTGRVPEEQLLAMKAALKSRFAAFTDRPLAINHIALFAEPSNGAPFKALAIRQLQPATSRKIA